jgi:L-threonylcarbamoyladenylate synthase
MVRRTVRLIVDPLDLEGGREAIAEAAALLRAGGTVAFATETVYGLGASALDAAAVARIFEAKQRPAWDPLIVHIADAAMLSQVAARIPEPARLWIEAFWPGPLTLLLPRGAAVPDVVTAGRARVGVRWPAHPVALALGAAIGMPAARNSANLFGHVSPTTADHVLADLDGRIDAVLDAGSTEYGLESTVVDTVPQLPGGPCLIYRPGAIGLEELAALWPGVAAYAPTRAAAGGTTGVLEGALPAALPSPGVGLRHYAPRARLVLIEKGQGLQAAQPARLLKALRQRTGTRTGVLLPEGLLPGDTILPEGVEIFAWGRWDRPEILAQRLFQGLRALDATGVERIVCPLPQEEGIGVALCDRLRKAARAV